MQVVTGTLLCDNTSLMARGEELGRNLPDISGDLNCYQNSVATHLDSSLNFEEFNRRSTQLFDLVATSFSPDSDDYLLRSAYIDLRKGMWAENAHDPKLAMTQYYFANSIFAQLSEGQNDIDKRVFANKQAMISSFRIGDLLYRARSTPQALSSFEYGLKCIGNLLDVNIPLDDRKEAFRYCGYAMNQVVACATEIEDELALHRVVDFALDHELDLPFTHLNITNARINILNRAAIIFLEKQPPIISADDLEETIDRLDMYAHYIHDSPDIEATFKDMELAKTHVALVRLLITDTHIRLTSIDRNNHLILARLNFAEALNIYEARNYQGQAGSCKALEAYTLLQENPPRLLDAEHTALEAFDSYEKHFKKGAYDPIIIDDFQYLINIYTESIIGKDAITKLDAIGNRFQALFNCQPKPEARNNYYPYNEFYTPNLN